MSPVALLVFAAAAAQAVPVPHWTRVVFVSGDQVYVGAGRDSGVVEGATLQVVRGTSDSAVATLRVLYVSSARAACAVVSGVRDLTPGDRVRYTPAAVPVVTAARTDSGRAVRPARRRAGGGLHGRVAARYDVSQLSGSGELARPALDARLAGTRLGGSPVGLVADVRARSSRARIAGAPFDATEATVYQLALLWNAPGAPLRAAVGRQYVAALSSVVLLDGVLTELNGRRVSAGIFGGAEPDVDLGFSTTVQTGGAYLQLHSAANTTRPTRWSLTTGAVGSYQAMNANREFGFLRLTVTSPVVSLHAAQEIDVYRSARRLAGEAPLSLTSSYVAASVRPAPGWSVDAGFDNRRNVRLYRDAVDPLTAFDDSYRQGMWGGIGVSRGRARARFEGRTAAGGAAGRALAVSASAGVTRLGPGGLELWGRTTRYGSGELHGWLHALRLGVDPLPLAHVELAGGLRRETNPPVSLGVRRTTWAGLETDLAVSRAWYVLLAAQRESGPDGRLDIASLSVSWRF